jgi:hypothetical protein
MPLWFHHLCKVPFERCAISAGGAPSWDLGPVLNFRFSLTAIIASGKAIEILPPCHLRAVVLLAHWRNQVNQAIDL